MLINPPLHVSDWFAVIADLSKVNLDGDFDEREHEAQMKAILGEDFEDQEEAEADPKQLCEHIPTCCL